MDEQLQDLAKSSLNEIRDIFPEHPWALRIFRFDWGSVRKSSRAGEVPVPQMHEVAHSGHVRNDAWVEAGPAATGLLQCAVVGACEEPARGHAGFNPNKQDFASVYSFPIFHPTIHQANPGTPLLLGAAAYAGPLSLAQAIEDYKLPVLGGKYAGLVASRWARDERSSSYPAEVFLANSIDIDGKTHTFELDERLNELEDSPRVPKRISEMKKKGWYEFSPGLYASITALMEYRFFRDRIGKSRAYMKRLEEAR